MASLIPMALYGLEIPAGDVAMSGRPEVPSAYRITMAAIDPSAEAEGEDGAVPRATLKIIRQPLDLDDFDEDSEDDYDEDDFDAEEMERILAEQDEDSEEDDEEEDDEAAAGPSDPKKSKAARKAAAEAEIRALLAAEGMDLDETKVNGLSAKAKGKQPASDDDSEDDEDEEMYDSDDSDLEGEIEEFVICTLDPSKNWQQPLDITIGQDERVWFKVSGTHSIFLTGNYVADPEEANEMYDPEDDDEDDYDLEPDSDELDEDDLDSQEEDELDALANPRISEIEEEEAPQLVKAEKKSKSKKRAAEEDESLDALIKAESEEPKLSKKQQKKLKKNDGSAAVVENGETGSAKSDKKVQFAKNLEQGPTPTKEKAAEKSPKAAAGPRVVQGVTIDDKKVGSGPASKKGDRVGMRYIGKLKDGKVFDSNKKGKPFTFKLGAGEVIKGWEVGIAGLAVGGERRITVPAHLAYGSKALPGIPANSTLIFDVKLVDLNKGK